VMAIVALIHDMIIVFGVFVILGYPIDNNFIAVVLTILGYSINDTIVIYDRIRENQGIYGHKLKIGKLVNLSINQTLGRTICTSAATISSVLVIAVVALIANIDSIVSFAIPLLIGMIAGTYSSICISSNLWVLWKERKENAKPVKK
ncbi:MAG: protein translocase subunit SecF, partial [Oscillospiraceae bacterium]